MAASREMCLESFKALADDCKLCVIVIENGRSGNTAS